MHSVTSCLSSFSSAPAAIRRDKRSFLHLLAQRLRRQAVALVCVVSLGVIGMPAAQAQSEASTSVSLLPVASVVVTASALQGVAGDASAAAGDASAAVVALPVALSVTGAVLTVTAVQASGRGSVIVLERASDGVAVSLELSGLAVGNALLSVGSAITTTVIASGVILSAAGEAVAFLPNAIGQTLLFNQQIS